ncbi:MAG: hypothetical protein LBT27_09065 [Prevotellaceae bacterium]|jgi:hypothetical protein|nr:hypothetical protein [Prevotellaceae bacterium]
MKKFVYFLSIISIINIVSCAPAQKIVYSLDQIPVSQDFSNTSVSIHLFNDIRNQLDDNSVYLTSASPEKVIEKKRQCINTEKLYKIPVNEQITDIFAQHLKKKNYFSRVFVNQKDSADYYVTANIVHFAGGQQFSVKSAIGAGFGLIGAIATANLKTDGSIIIELSDINIYDKNNNLVAQIGNLKKEYSGKFPVTADCYCIYRNINDKLSEFNEELTQIIWLELKDKK